MASALSRDPIPASWPNWRIRMSENRARIQFGFRLIATTMPFLLIAPLQAKERKVLTIAMDGVRPDALAVANTPNIDSLLNGTFFGTGDPSGIFSMNAQAEHLTFSGPGWGAYMTGLHVDRLSRLFLGSD